MFALALVPVVLSAQAADAAKGKELYTKKCQMCHAADGAGTPANQKKFGDKWKAFGSAEVQAMKPEALAKAFKDDPVHKAIASGVTDADLANIAAHIKTFKK
jgi:cytochrome c553